jgi:hypothetical protein
LELKRKCDEVEVAQEELKLAAVAHCKLRRELEGKISALQLSLSGREAMS